MAHFIGAARSIAFAVCGFLLITPCLAQTLPPVEAFGQLPTISQPELSPNGKYLAVIQSYQGRPAALIYDITAPVGTEPIIFPYLEGFIVGVTWANDNRLLITVNYNATMGGEGLRAWFRTISIDVNGKNPVTLFSNMGDSDYNFSASEIADLAIDDPDHVYMPFWTEYETHKFRNSLFKVDVNTGKAKEVVIGRTETKEFIMDGHGNVVARLDHTNHPMMDYLFLKQGDTWNEVAQYNAEGDKGANITGISADGSALVQMLIKEDTGILGLVKRQFSDGKISDLFFDQKYDIDGAIHDPWTMRVIGVSTTADISEYQYFDPQMAVLQKGLESAFSGNSVHAVSWDLLRRKVIVQVDGPYQPTTYFFLNRDTHEARRIGSAYPGLRENDLGEVSPTPYKARDGLDIPAYLTLPPGKEPKNLPTIIMPHGGPMARDAMGFDWMAQFFANRGYAVLQSNFRGSSGYGKKFEEAGYGQWGLKMQDDVTDGVKKLIADGIADPKRICIFGASYGGYAALAGAAFTPDLYACAASWAGVFDLKLFLNTRARDYGRDSAMIASWTHFIGDRWNETDKLNAASPAQHADRIKVPVLLLHGKDDSTVKIDQSEVMESALKRAGKKVTFIAVEGETHYMQSAETRIRVLKELEKFLAANIGN